MQSINKTHLTLILKSSVYMLPRHNLVAERMSHLVIGSVFILSIDSRYDTQVECSGGNVKVCI